MPRATPIACLHSSECPEGEFAEYTGSGSVLYVKPGGYGFGGTAVGGLTSCREPSMMVSPAYEYNTNTSVTIEAILVAKEPQRNGLLGQDIQVIGACPDETHIFQADFTASVVMTGDAETLLEGVSTEGSNLGIWIVGTASATLRDVKVNGQGVSISDYLDYPDFDLVPQATLEQVVIDGTVDAYSAMRLRERIRVFGQDVVISDFQGNDVMTSTVAFYVDEAGS